MPNELEQLKHAPAEIHDLLARRWSPRTFTEKPIADSALHMIFTAAGWAASSSNEQPWRFLVGRRGEETYDKIFDTLVQFNQDWAKTAPVLVLTVAKKTTSPQPNKPGGAPNPYALHDTGAASANLCLQAVALGIHTHGMAGFDKDQARKNFAIPDDFEIGVVWALGYLGSADDLPDHLKKMELAPRERKPLEQIVFSAWETPAKF